MFVLGALPGILEGSKKDTEVPVTKNIHTEKENAKPKDKSDESDKLKKLEAQLEKIVMDKHPEVELSFAIKNLDTGAGLMHNSKKLNSASVVKLFIAGTVYDKLGKGTYKLTDTRRKELELMITESDNAASREFVDDFGGQNPETRKIEETNGINVFIKENGFKDTELNRKMHDTTPPEGPTGYENYTSVEDVVRLLEGVYNKTFFKEPYNTEFMNLLKSQVRRTKIPAKIAEKYPGIVVANKTGELSRVENDVAIIMGKDFNIIFAVMINDIPLKADGSTDYALKENVQATIADMGLAVADFYMQNKF